MAATTGDWKSWLPFADLQGFVRLAIGVVLILLAIRIFGARKLVLGA
jgi:hypothetical protein